MTMSPPAPAHPHDPVAVSTSVEPIVAGFWPDPTVCRVGEDYYLANSSFEYFPGVPIWHSRDLLTWTLITNAFDDPAHIAPGGSHASGGIFAPTLRHHDGRFFLITTDVTRGTGVQLVASATDPAGPWSPPVLLEGLVGIDPDLAWDEAGRCYVTFCSTDSTRHGIAQAAVDLDTGAILEPSRIVWGGTGMSNPEGPHLYRRGDWWYLMIAEGGTERGHAITVARSHSPEGPFDEAPHNPILTHRSSKHVVQNTGHGDLVERADGSWAMVYLGVRPAGNTPHFHVNGRETFLAGVDWVGDWPVVVEDRFAAPVPDRSFVDGFAGPLHPRWVSAGAPPAELSDPHPDGGLVLRPSRTADGAAAGLTVRITDQRWTLDADVAADPGATLRLRLDDRHWCELSVGDDLVVRATVRIGPLEHTWTGAAASADGATLRIASVDPAADGPDDLVLSAGPAGAASELVRFDGRYLSTEVAGGFTGRVAVVSATDAPVHLREVRYSAIPA